MTTLTDALTHPHTCCEEVTRNHEVEPCDRTAVAVVDHPGNDWIEPGAWPVCKRHAWRRRNHLVPLAELLACVWEQGAVQLDNPYAKEAK